MKPGIERNLGEQPIARLMAERELRAHDLVAASERPLTHKAVSRACKGRRLTPHTRDAVVAAFNRAADETLGRKDLFTY